MTGRDETTEGMGMATVRFMTSVPAAMSRGYNSYGLTLVSGATATQLVNAVMTLNRELPDAQIQLSHTPPSGEAARCWTIVLFLPEADEQYRLLKKLKGMFVLDAPLTAEVYLTDDPPNFFDARVKVLDYWNPKDHACDIDNLVSQLTGVEGITRVQRVGSGIDIQATGQWRERFEWLDGVFRDIGIKTTMFNRPNRPDDDLAHLYFDH